MQVPINFVVSDHGHVVHFTKVALEQHCNSTISESQWGEFHLFCESVFGRSLSEPINLIEELDFHHTELKDEQYLYQTTERFLSEVYNIYDTDTMVKQVIELV